MAAVTEEWRSHPEHPGIEVSSRGRVRSYHKMGPRGGFNPEPRILNPGVDPDGYVRISVKCMGGKRKRRGVHQLVAEVFKAGLRFEGAMVLHNNGIPSDNEVRNLRWGTPGDNMADRAAHGTLGLTRSAAEIAEIRRLCRMGFKQREVARVFKTTQAYVSNLVTGKQRRDVA